MYSLCSCLWSATAAYNIFVAGFHCLILSLDEGKTTHPTLLQGGNCPGSVCRMHLCLWSLAFQVCPSLNQMPLNKQHLTDTDWVGLLLLHVSNSQEEYMLYWCRNCTLWEKWASSNTQVYLTCCFVNWFDHIMLHTAVLCLATSWHISVSTTSTHCGCVCSISVHGYSLWLCLFNMCEGLLIDVMFVQ